MTTSDIETRTITTPDGRELMLEIGGDPAGKLVVAHNGTPNSRHMYGPWVDDAARQGIRLVSYDRPGYGGSTAQPGRTVADCVVDVRAIAAALDATRLGVWGASGGGPHALACAALLPDMVVGAAAVCSIAPYGVEGLDYFTGMGEENADDIRLFLDDRVASREKSRQDRIDILQHSAADVGHGMESLLSPVDKAVLVDAFAEWLVLSAADGLATSDEGWWEDAVAHMEPWGFDVAAIRVPVQVWHGRQDKFVPFQHGQWLAAHVPNAEAHLSDTDGHLTLTLNHITDVHRWLLDRF
jgi:pimeloyl-ACP methyl ester carboxylesterase